MKCDKCKSNLIFVNNDKENGLKGYWKCFYCCKQHNEIMNIDDLKLLLKTLFETGSLAIKIVQTFDEWNGENNLIQVFIDGEKVYESNNNIT